MLNNPNELQSLTAGVDEAGAGTWAGNLIVASCVLDPNKPILGLGDSKKLSPETRERLYDEICANALEFKIITVTPEEIDRSNILNCRMEGMARAINSLTKATNAIVDGDRVPSGVNIPTRAVIKADDTIDCASAASILAKVYHDREITKAAELYPNFDFASHKGYGTAKHKQELAKFGATPLHRKSFKPVKNTLQLNLNSLPESSTEKETHMASEFTF
jgi:ribonuclease HII